MEFFVPFPIEKLLAVVCTTIKKTGKYNKRLDNWDLIPVTTEIYGNFKMIINDEFTKQEKDSQYSAGKFGQANMIQELEKIAKGTVSALL